MKGTAVWVARRAGEVVTLLLLAAWLVWLRPVALGGTATYILVRGDSMEPTYHSGELVLLQQVPVVRVGDVVAYRVPEHELGAGHVVIHRIVALGPDGRFDLRGDNNPSIDLWHPTTDDIIGQAQLAIPGVGTVLAALTRPAIAGGLALALLVAWAVQSGRLDPSVRRSPRGGIMVPCLPPPHMSPRPIIASSSSAADSAASTPHASSAVTIAST